MPFIEREYTLLTDILLLQGYECGGEDIPFV
jgi:hypothetical protein